MTQFVHLTDAKQTSAIRRNGIKANTVRGGEIRGFYCTPVSRSVFRTHQWLRELKRRGTKTIEAVQFYLPSAQPVFVGRYDAEYICVPASEAAGIFDAHQSGLGLEVVVPRAIPPSSIRRVYAPSQVLGWRFHPGAKGSKPFYGCKFCNRGEINAYRFVTEE
jgi:hypothetical protein